MGTMLLANSLLCMFNLFCETSKKEEAKHLLLYKNPEHFAFKLTHQLKWNLLASIILIDRVILHFI